MRSSKSRSRSKQNRPRTLGNIINRVFDSSGPEGKVRGTPQQIIEKYQLLSRDAQLSNDRVAAENFLQHAEHYTRLLGEALREMAAEQESRQQQSGQNGNQGGQGGNTNSGNQGGGNGNRDRDYRGERDNRPQWRDDRGPESGDGNFAPSVIDSNDDQDTGLVETPEARSPRHDSDADTTPRQDARPPRADRQQSDRQQGDRQQGERPQGERQQGERQQGERQQGERQQGERPPRNRDEQRRERGPRPPRAAQEGAGPVPTAPVPAAPVQTAPLAESPVVAALPEAAPKPPRRARAPKKAADTEPDAGSNGPQEAAE